MGRRVRSQRNEVGVIFLCGPIPWSDPVLIVPTPQDTSYVRYFVHTNYGVSYGVAVLELIKIGQTILVCI